MFLWTYCSHWQELCTVYFSMYNIYIVYWKRQSIHLILFNCFVHFSMYNLNEVKIVYYSPFSFASVSFNGTFLVYHTGLTLSSIFLIFFYLFFMPSVFPHTYAVSAPDSLLSLTYISTVVKLFYTFILCPLFAILWVVFTVKTATRYGL